MPPSSLLTQAAYGLAWWLCLIIAFTLYLPGLQGGFIYDDYPNLYQLAFINDDVSAEILRFIQEGHAGILGRPISLLTFALQHHHWAENPAAFKYINILIHLLNACLIAWLLLRLCQWQTFARTHPQRIWLIALLTAALWLLHPLNVSTVLYVVQRMTQLATLFILLGILAYVYGRERMAHGRIVQGYLLASSGIILGGTLATLSKENGVLLVFYILALELTLLRSLPRPAYFKPWFTCLILIPILALISYFILTFPTLYASYATRDFTFEERILTQTRVIWDYLAKIILLIPNDFGLYHDDFTLSSNLITPRSTLLAITALLAAATFALYARARYPLIAFAILWFFAGHLLESTIVPLLLYFEHRNYLAMISILFAIVYGIVYLYDLAEPPLRHLIIGISLFLILAFPALTFSEVEIWSNPTAQAANWAENNPRSLLSQSHALGFFADKTPVALHYLERLNQTYPHDTRIYAMWLVVGCSNPQLPIPTAAVIQDSFSKERIYWLTIENLHTLLDFYSKKQCTSLGADNIYLLFAAIAQNPSLQTFSHSFYHLYARLYAIDKQYDDAIEMAEKSIQISPNPQVQKERIIWMAEAQRQTQALQEIIKLRAQLHPVRDRLHLRDLDQIEQVIQKSQQNPQTP